MVKSRRRLWVWITVVVVVVGAASAIVIPELTTQRHRRNQKRTMADMRTLATAIETREIVVREYPAVDSIDALEPLLVPKYIKALPRRDGWGRPFRYESSKEGYAITSAARDGLFEKPSAKDYKGGMVEDLDGDIVFSDGVFTQYPPGVGRN